MAKRATSNGTTAPAPAPAEMPAGVDTAAQQILADYLNELKAVRATGAGVPETSYYPALSNLFNAVGKTLKPKVRCVINISNQGAGLPDGGLFTADQFQRNADDSPKAGQLPARGAIEAKGTKPAVKAIAASQQVKDYLTTYGIVLVTNLREFVIVERGPTGEPVEREAFALVVGVEGSCGQNVRARGGLTAETRRRRGICNLQFAIAGGGTRPGARRTAGVRQRPTRVICFMYVYRVRGSGAAWREERADTFGARSFAALRSAQDDTLGADAEARRRAPHGGPGLPRWLPWQSSVAC